MRCRCGGGAGHVASVRQDRPEQKELGLIRGARDAAGSYCAAGARTGEAAPLVSPRSALPASPVAT